MRISAVTLPTKAMAKAVRFYKQLGFEMHRGGESAAFTTFQVGDQHLNLRLTKDSRVDFGSTLVIFAVDDVDQAYQRILDQKLVPEFAPRDAEWGERYFHICDPDGNVLSFAKHLHDEDA